MSFAAFSSSKAQASRPRTDHDPSPVYLRFHGKHAIHQCPPRFEKPAIATRVAAVARETLQCRDTHLVRWSAPRHSDSDAQSNKSGSWQCLGGYHSRCHHNGRLRIADLPDWDWYDISAHLKCTKCGSIGWVDTRLDWSEQGLRLTKGSNKISLHPKARRSYVGKNIHQLPP